MAQIILDSNSNLIQGDFNSATVNNRTKLQTSTTNATTGVYVVPNGSATSASVQMANAADPTNASKIVVATNGATDTQIVSGANGSGSYLPLSFYTNNDIRFQMGNAGELNVRTAPGTVSSGTSGQFLTSGGPGAGVSWTTAASGQIQAQLFTSPGTWTKPASCTQVKVIVVGGGGGGGSFGPAGASGTPGGTSSFGPLISATGGSGGINGGSPPFPVGVGTLGPGVTLYKASTPVLVLGTNLFGSMLTGSSTTNPTAAPVSTYTVAGTIMAGSGGTGSGATGGWAYGLVPVSAPVVVTVGAGGAKSPSVGAAVGVAGAVLVEFIG